MSELERKFRTPPFKSCFEEFNEVIRSQEQYRRLVTELGALGTQVCVDRVLVTEPDKMPSKYISDAR
ncbi:hypothetical protein HGB25_02180, partial [Candidatus Saccharibacteria bacterium]|nr:hypothetical protein [Candidatus Saccharibacteria bacterium]